jgi:hypothetical protein
LFDKEWMTMTTANRSTVPRWRRILAGALIVVGCVLAPVSVLAVWIHGTLLDTDQYVDTIGPLADDPAIQQAVANRVTTAVIEASDIETKVANALPDRVSFAAPFVADGAERVVHAAALRFTESDRFPTLWEEINRRAHTQVVAVLQGEGTDTVTTKNGEVVVRIGPIVDRIAQQLADRGITVLADVDPQRANREVVLFQSSDLRSAQGLVDLLDKIAIVLPILTIVLLAAGIALSGNRRRTALRAALGVALAMVLLLTLLNVGRRLYLDALPATVNQDAAAAVYDQLLSFLFTSLRAAFAVAAVIGIGAWIAGPGAAATRVRTGVRDALRGHPAGTPPSPLATFVDRYRTALRVLAVGIGLVFLVALAHPSPSAVLVIAILVVAALALIEFLGRTAVAVVPEPAHDHAE